MKEEISKEELLYRVVSEVKRSPGFMKLVIESCIYGCLEANKELNEHLIKSEKAAFMLFKGKEMKTLIEYNADDIAQALSRSHFNGTNKKFTKEDVIKRMKTIPKFK